MKYYGYKLVMLTTLDGTPYSFELVPANTDERAAADEILDTLPSDSNAWSDKGFIGEEWQADWSRQGIQVWTTKRENQKVQNPPEFDRLDRNRDGFLSEDEAPQGPPPGQAGIGSFPGAGPPARTARAF